MTQVKQQFNDLDTDSDELPVPKPQLRSGGKIDASVLGIPKKLTASEAKARKDELHKIEPGYKVAVLSVGTIVGTWCENCGSCTMQVLKFDGSKLRCLDCKQDRFLKKR